MVELCSFNLPPARLNEYLSQLPKERFGHVYLELVHRLVFEVWEPTSVVEWNPGEYALAGRIFGEDTELTIRLGVDGAFRCVWCSDSASCMPPKDLEKEVIRPTDPLDSILRKGAETVTYLAQLPSGVSSLSEAQVQGIAVIAYVNQFEEPRFYRWGRLVGRTE